MRRSSTCVLGLLLILSFGKSTHADQAAKPVRVVVWDEQQPAQKQAYENFLGNAIADYLRQRPGLEVKSVRLDDPEQGLANETLDNCDVLIWWGHVRQGEIKRETGQKIVDRIKQRKLSLIALHSAHWSVPFIEAMNERAISDALATLSPEERKVAKVEAIRPEKYSSPPRNAKMTPNLEKIVHPDGKIELKIQLPNCCFPALPSRGMACSACCATATLK